MAGHRLLPICCEEDCCSPAVNGGFTTGAVLIRDGLHSKNSCLSRWSRCLSGTGSTAADDWDTTHGKTTLPFGTILPMRWGSGDGRRNLVMIFSTVPAATNAKEGCH